jgi:hypothetical protein
MVKEPPQVLDPHPAPVGLAPRAALGVALVLEGDQAL